MSPTNPTGRVLTAAEVDAIVTVATRHDLYVISDELYEKLIFDDLPHIALAGQPGMAERTLIRPPASRMGPVTAAERAATLTSQLLAFSRKQVVALQVVDGASLDAARCILSDIVGTGVLTATPDARWIVDTAPVSRAAELAGRAKNLGSALGMTGVSDAASELLERA